jgi:hypothetical protein
MSSVHAGTGFLNVIAASLTPAILILAAGSLVSSTLARISRIVDRARFLIDRICEARSRGDAAVVDAETVMLRIYQRRSALVARALILFYAAIGLFVASSLAIATDGLTKNALPWLSLALVILGTILILTGTLALVFEANIASNVLESEILSTCSAAGTSSRNIA